METGQKPQSDIALTIPESKSVATKTAVDLGIRFLFSTPKKLVLLLFIFMVLNILSAYAYSLYAFSDSNLGGGYWVGVNNFSYYPGRIVVKKTDNSPITPEEITALKNIKGVKNVIKYDLALEQSAYFYFENIDYSYYNTLSAVQANKEKDLIAGSRLPKTKTKWFSVRYLPEETELKDLLNQPICLRFEVEDSARDAVIVGVFEGEGEIYVTDPVLERLQQLAIMSVSSFSFTIPGAPPVERGLIIIPDATLSGKEAILKMVVGETRTIGPFTTDVNFSNLFLTRTLKDLNVTVRMEDYPGKEAGYGDWRSQVENDYGYLPRQILRVSEENLPTSALTIFSSQHHPGKPR